MTGKINTAMGILSVLTMLFAFGSIAGSAAETDEWHFIL